MTSRIFLPTLLASAAAAIVFVGFRANFCELKDEESESEPGSEDEESSRADRSDCKVDDATLRTSSRDPAIADNKAAVKQERMWYLDYARIICVACTVTEHSGGDHYSDRNLIWGQQWVLPYLYTISGISFMLSRSSLMSYQLKLLVVFLVGVSANWLADMYSGRDWESNFGNTIFQMAYVLVLLGFGFFLAPLKQALRWRSDNQLSAPTKTVAVWLFVYGACLAVPLWYFVTKLPIGDPQETPAAKGTLEQARNSGLASLVYAWPLFLSKSFGLIFLAFLACYAKKSDLAGWILLFVSYAGHVVIPFSKGGHPLNSDLFVIGMVTLVWPLRGSATIASIMREYWPLLLLVLMILSTPEVTGRCDLHPFNTLWERFRFRAIEVTMVLALITGALNTSDSRRITPWLNQWALAAYCLHVAFARTLPVPYGACLTYSGVIPFWLYDRHNRRKTRAEVYSQE